MAIAIELEKRVGDLAAVLRNPVLLHEMLSGDPVLARELCLLQEETRKQLDHLVLQVEAAGGDDNTKQPADIAAQDMSVGALTRGARKREVERKERSESIRAMCLAVMVNSGNPKWNPQDEKTYCNPEESTLLALLEADLSRY